MRPPPEMMRALVMDAIHPDVAAAIRNLRVASLPVPKIGNGQVLVRIEAAPCNPADLLLLQGKYGITRDLPGIPGLEASGVVVAVGGGLLGKWLNGKRVICGGHDASGTWAEYCRASATNCLPLRYGLTLEQGATALANPITAMALLDLVKKGGHRAAVQTAAAGQLGRMLATFAVEAGLPMIHVVRRTDQVESVRETGARHVLDSSTAGFDAELARLSRELGATIALDAVGGDMTGRLANALPDSASVVVYGSLSGEPSGNLDPMKLCFDKKSVQGFEIARWLREAGLLRAFRLGSRAQRLVAAGKITTTVAGRFSLDEAKDGLVGYANNMSKGKILIRPNAAGASS